jgi:hypothetical protein
MLSPDILAIVVTGAKSDYCPDLWFENAGGRIGRRRLDRDSMSRHDNDDFIVGTSAYEAIVADLLAVAVELELARPEIGAPPTGTEPMARGRIARKL